MRALVYSLGTFLGMVVLRRFAGAALWLLFRPGGWVVIAAAALVGSQMFGQAG